MSHVGEIPLHYHMDVLIKVRIWFESSGVVLPVNDGWKCRSTSDNGIPSRKLRWCAAAACCFRLPDDLQTLGHWSQGKALLEAGGMVEWNDK